MRIAGIIAEYDPFHSGHAAHITAARAAGATHIVIVMSGNFTQRGKPALLPKARRAAMALAGGADLVLELPVPWAMAPAEVFATGGIALLRGLGYVQALSFGCECGAAAPLQTLAAAMDTPDYSAALRQALQAGVPYAAARQTAAAALCGDETAAVLSHPNNTLGIEYIRAAARMGANLDILAVPRRGAGHHDTAAADGIASGTALRRLIRAGQAEQAAAYMPAAAAAILETALREGEAPADPHRLDMALLAHLRLQSRRALAALPYISEGLENRLWNAIRQATTLSELETALHTRRYPAARLRRILWASMLRITPSMVQGIPPYLRVLGMNGRGREILTAAAPTLPLISRFAQVRELPAAAQAVFAAECRSSDLYTLMLPRPTPCGGEQQYHIITE